MRVRSLAPLRRGAEIPVRIYVPEKMEPLRCNGIVVWSNGSGSTGMRFVNLNESDQKILAEWLIELEKAAKTDLLTPPEGEFARITNQIKNEKLNNADALSLVARRTKELTAASGVAIALGTPLNMACMASAGAAPAIGTVIPPSAGLTGECIRTRRIVHCQNAENDPRIHKEVKIGSAVVLPLIVNGEVRGVLEAYSTKPYAFGAKCMEDLQSLGDAVIFVAHGMIPARRKPSIAQFQQAEKAASAAPPASHTPASLPKLPDNIAVVTASAAASPAASTNSIVVPIAEPMKTAPQPLPTMKPLAPTPRPTTPVPAVHQRTVIAPLAAPVAPKPMVRTPDIPAPRPKANFVLELGPDEGFDPPAKPTAPVETSYTPSSSSRTWIVAVTFMVVVGAVGSFWFMRQQKNAVPVAAASVVSPAVTPHEAAPTPSVQTTEHVAPVTAPTPAVVQPAASTPAITKHVVETPTPVVHDVVKPAAPQPAAIVLSARKSVPKQTIDDNIVVPGATQLRIAPNVPAVPLPAVAAVPKLQAPPQKVMTGGTLEKSAQPFYPPTAKMMRLQGEVELQFRVTKDGTVDNVKVVSGHSLLASAAVDAVKRWKYVPLKINGVPAEMERTVKLSFVLPR